MMPGCARGESKIPPVIEALDPEEEFFSCPMRRAQLVTWFLATDFFCGKKVLTTSAEL
jgi:hypothetical protein